MKLRIGLVGLGDAWELKHRPALLALSDRFEIKAVCEEIALRAEQVAREFNASAVDGYQALAAREDIDAILMLSPQWYGPLPILAACDAGKAIYCGAALEIDLEMAQRIKQRVEQSGIAFMAEFPRRHAPATLRLKELTATVLGRPRLLFCHHRLLVEPVARAGPGGRITRPATRHLLELIDWCRYVVGQEPTSVMGVKHMAEDESGLDDYQMMSLDFSPPQQIGTGPMAQISCGHYISNSWQESITFRPPAALQVCCENGIAFVDLPSTLIWFDEAGRHMESLEGERPVGERLLMQFYRTATSLVRNISSLEDAYRTLMVLKTVQDSYAEGHRLTVKS